MDNATRKLIQEATQSACKLLEREYGEQLSGIYDILLDGSMAPEPGAHLDPSQRLIRRKLVGAINHKIEKARKAEDAKIEKAQKEKDAVAEYLREAAFTTLNRFVALKMLESRGLTQECVSRGEQSAGFREFSGLAPGCSTRRNSPASGPMTRPSAGSINISTARKSGARCVMTPPPRATATNSQSAINSSRRATSSSS